jgi:EAL domain-containing protein (putative c-di-GMP-specific phosphodiesterase class I)
MTVVAEGVETREQADHLRRAGCSLLQGFLFGSAQPAGDFGRDLLPA